MSSKYLEFDGLSITFGRNKALEDVSFHIGKERIHGLLGEADSGKSVLLKILAGIYKADNGCISLNGTPIRSHSPHEVTEQGICVINQDPEFASGTTVREYLGQYNSSNTSKLLDHHRFEVDAIERLREYDETISLQKPLDDLTLMQKRLVAIARTIASNAQVIALDEPCAKLTVHETDQIFEIIEALRDEGRTIIWGTRHMGEIYRIADEATVLREGKHIQTYTEVKNITTEDLLSQLTGTDISELTKARAQRMMRGVIHNVGNSATVTSLAQKEALARLDKDCLPLVDFLKDELLPTLQSSIDPDCGAAEHLISLNQICDHLKDNLHQITDSMRTLDERLEHIGSVVEMQQTFLDELGTEDLTVLNKVLTEAISVLRSPSERISISLPKDSPRVLLDRSMFIQLLSSLLCELLATGIEKLSAEIVGSPLTCCLTLRSTSPVPDDSLHVIQAIAEDCQRFIGKYSGNTDMRFTPDTFLSFVLPIFKPTQ